MEFEHFLWMMSGVIFTLIPVIIVTLIRRGTRLPYSAHCTAVGCDLHINTNSDAVLKVIMALHNQEHAVKLTKGSI